jgi:Ca2+-binding EF-hand superfamily protein
MKAREWERVGTRVRTPSTRHRHKNTQVRGGQAWDHRGSMNRNWELLFKRLDADKSGRLDYDEFERAVREELRVTDTTDQELRALWAYVDHDKSGEVTISEFQHGCYLLILEGWPLLGKDRLEDVVAVINGAAKRWLHASSWVKVFRAIDQDENDRLGYDELERVVRANGTQGGLSLTTSDLTDNDLRGLWRALDKDVSGEVTIDEFMNFMRRKEEKPKPKTPPPPPKSRRWRRAPSPDHSVRTQDTAATTQVPPHVGDYLATSTTLDNIQRETGCKLSVAKNEVTFSGSDFQIRAARAAVAAASSRILPPLASPQPDDDDSTIATVEKLPPVRRRPTPVKIVNALSDSPYGQTGCSPSNRHSGLASGWWGGRVRSSRVVRDAIDASARWRGGRNTS